MCLMVKTPDTDLWKCLKCLQLKKDEQKVYSVALEEDQRVRNLKAAVVKVYDYYQTSKCPLTST